MRQHIVKVSSKRQRRGASYVCACALIAMPVVACAQPQDDARSTGTGGQTTRAGQDATVSVDALSQKPQEYQGETVTVRAEVEEILSPNLFTLDEDNVISAGRDVLVFVARPDAVPQEGKTITVTGTVRPFVRADFMRDFDWFYADPDLFVRFSSRPVVVATSGQLESGVELMRAPTPMTEQRTIGTGGRAASGRESAQAPAEVSAGELADSPERFFGRRVSVQAEVEQVFGPRLFTLDEDKFFSTGRDVLVLMPEAEAVPLDGAQVTVTGVLRPFVKTDVIRNYSWLTLDPGLWIRFDRRPAIVAESVQTSWGAELIAKPPATGAMAAPTSASRVGGGDAIAAISSIVSSSDKAALVGRPVGLSNVTVQRVASDRSFWVGDTEPQLFVVVDAGTLKQATPGAGTVREGQKVTIDGQIKQLPGTRGTVEVTDWGAISDVDAGMLKNREVYVYANRVKVE